MDTVENTKQKGGHPVKKNWNVVKTKFTEEKNTRAQEKVTKTL